MDDAPDLSREDEDEPFVEEPKRPAGSEGAEREQTRRLPAPINWWIKSPLERQILVDTLKDFVMRLSEEYELDAQVLRPCWFKHPGIIQELLALWQWRNYQIYDADQLPQGGLDFHIQLRPFIDRVSARTRATGCTGVEHVDWEAPAWLGTGEAATNYSAELVRYWNRK